MVDTNATPPPSANAPHPAPQPVPPQGGPPQAALPTTWAGAVAFVIGLLGGSTVPVIILLLIAALVGGGTYGILYFQKQVSEARSEARKDLEAAQKTLLDPFMGLQTLAQTQIETLKKMYAASGEAYQQILRQQETIDAQSEEMNKFEVARLQHNTETEQFEADRQEFEAHRRVAEEKLHDIERKLEDAEAILKAKQTSLESQSSSLGDLRENLQELVNAVLADTCVDDQCGDSQSVQLARFIQGKLKSPTELLTTFAKSPDDETARILEGLVGRPFDEVKTALKALPSESGFAFWGEVVLDGRQRGFIGVRERDTDRYSDVVAIWGPNVDGSADGRISEVLTIYAILAVLVPTKLDWFIDETRSLFVTERDESSANLGQPLPVTEDGWTLRTNLTSENVELTETIYGQPNFADMALPVITLETLNRQLPPVYAYLTDGTPSVTAHARAATFDKSPPLGVALVQPAELQQNLRELLSAIVAKDRNRAQSFLEPQFDYARLGQVAGAVLSKTFRFTGSLERASASAPSQAEIQLAAAQAPVRSATPSQAPAQPVAQGRLVEVYGVYSGDLIDEPDTELDQSGGTRPNLRLVFRLDATAGWRLVDADPHYAPNIPVKF